MITPYFSRQYRSSLLPAMLLGDHDPATLCYPLPTTILSSASIIHSTAQDCAKPLLDFYGLYAEKKLSLVDSVGEKKNLLVMSILL